MRICIGYRLNGIIKKRMYDLFEKMQKGEPPSPMEFMKCFESEKLLFTRKYSKVIDRLREEGSMIHLFKITKVYDDATYEEVDMTKYYYKDFNSEVEKHTDILQTIDLELYHYEMKGRFSPFISKFLELFLLPFDDDQEKIKASLEQFKEKPFITIFRE